MAEPLPPLAAVRVFEAAARHLSFTKAAAELGMTQAAVSYQIKVIEDRVGAPLFLRRPRQVQLTETGRRLAAAASQAFDLLRDAYAEARGVTDGMLVINSLQTFATNWLAQHLGSFQIAHPRIAVRIEIENNVIDFARDEADVAVRSGAGKWPGLVAHRLIGADFTPMLSPKLAATIGGVNEPADLLRLPIIDPGDPWWTAWLTLAGVPTDDLKSRPATQMGSQSLEGRAAIAGQGVAILTPAFYRYEIESGQLIQPFDLVGNSTHDYWLVYPEARRNAAKVRAFREWLLPEIARTVGGG